MISRDNRQEIENEFMALLVNKPELLNSLQILPKYLHSEKNKKLLEELLFCNSKYKSIGPMLFLKMKEEFNKSVDINYYVKLLTEEFYYEKAWKEQLKLSEESIIKYYKEDIINSLNEKLKNKELTYDKFMNDMKKLDSITLVENIQTITVKEIMDNINAEKASIKFKKYQKINEILRLVKGDFLIIGATTGAGKSGFMLNLMNDLMEEYQCIYFNMEMSKSTIYKRLISINANVQVSDVNKPQSEFQKEIIYNSLNKIENSKIIIEHKATNINQIKSLVTKLKDKDRHTILFIDHLGLCRCDEKKGLYEQATEVAKQLRQMCLECDCTIISASQLNRGAYNSEEISLSMLKDSGELENSASKVILLSKSKENDKSENIVKMNVDVAKNRDGLCGTIKMEYDKYKQIFSEKSW